MEIKMLNTMITWNYRYESSNNTYYQNYDTEFIIKADETTTLDQINCLIENFYELEETNSKGEIYKDKRMIVLDRTKKKGTFIVRVSLWGEICFNEFMCETDDFQTFKWYARKVDIEEKAEDFKSIK